MLKVFSKRCKNCLLSKNDSIVSPQRVQEIIEECKTKKTHFTCHIATMDGQDIACKGFFDCFKDDIPKLQIVERLNLIEWVEQPPSEKLPSFKDYDT